jgi:mRNA interferase MazF
VTRGAVVTASIGGDSAKPRPFLVLRSDRFADHTMVTILAFSATIIDAPLLRVTVRPTPENGLERTSQAMIDHVQSVRLTRIQKEIGQLAGSDFQAILRAIAVYLGFADPPRARLLGRGPSRLGLGQRKEKAAAQTA